MKREILTQLFRLAHELKSKKRMAFPLDGAWEDLPPAQSGVYAIWCDDKCVYVGETCHLRHRLSDIVHGKHRFIRSRLTLGMTINEILENHRISFVTDFIGRKELEEFLTVKWLGAIPGRLGCCDDIDDIRNAVCSDHL